MRKAVMQEIRRYQADENLEFSIDPDGDDISKLRVTLNPPPDTPYSDGIFFLTITVPQQYPSTPPSIKFDTKIYHPNIDSDGVICLDDLKNNWKPENDLSYVIMFVYNLMAHPNWENPLEQSIGALYNSDPKAFEEKAREYTHKYAS